MKKLGIFLLSALAFGFTACDDYDEAIPQFNAQAPIMSVEGLEVAEGADIAAAMDLNTFKGDSLELIRTVKAELNEGTSITYIAEIALEENFADAASVELGNGKIAKAALDNVFRAKYGKTPNAHDLWFRFVPYMTDGNSKVKLSKDVYLMAKKQSVKPVDLGIVIDPKYYVIVDTWFGDGWDKSMVELTHEGDVFENPLFKGTVTLQAGAIQFMGSTGVEAALKDINTAFDNVWGPTDEKAMRGDLVKGTKATALLIEEEGDYQITIDMLNNTYAVEKVVPTMYMIGDFCGWDWAKATQMVPVNGNPKAEGKYWCMTYVGEKKGFKFNVAAAWNGTEFGFDGAEKVSNVEGVNFVNDGGNLAVDKAGWYLFGIEKVSTPAGTYKYTVNLFPAKVYVFGGCNGGIWNRDENWVFSIPTTADGEFVSPVLAKEDELRLCVNPLNLDGSQWAGDWWKTEFIFFDGKIAYRGIGGDQARVRAKADTQVYLNFSNGTAYMK